METRKGTPKCCTKAQQCRPYEMVYNVFLRDAKSVNREVSISYEDFLEYILIKNCHYCNDHIEWTLPYGQHDATGKFNRRYHLDRMDNALGYTKENCVVACKGCNFTKSGHLSYEEMVVIGRMRWKPVLQ